jgi:hypothetical protein
LYPHLRYWRAYSFFNTEKQGSPLFSSSLAGIAEKSFKSLSLNGVYDTFYFVELPFRALAQISKQKNRLGIVIESMELC